MMTLLDAKLNTMAHYGHKWLTTSLTITLILSKPHTTSPCVALLPWKLTPRWYATYFVKMGQELSSDFARQWAQSLPSLPPLLVNNFQQATYLLITRPTPNQPLVSIILEFSSIAWNTLKLRHGYCDGSFFLDTRSGTPTPQFARSLHLPIGRLRAHRSSDIFATSYLCLNR